jgi:hypothetical protein
MSLQRPGFLVRKYRTLYSFVWLNSRQKPANIKKLRIAAVSRYAAATNPPLQWGI